MTALGLQPFLAYPAVIKLRHGGEQRSFDSLQKAEDFVSSVSQNRTFAADPQGSGRAGAALSSARREGLGGPGWRRCRLPGRRWWREGYGCLLDLFFSFFFFPLSPGIVFTFIRYNCPFAGKTNPPFFFLFFLEGTNGE